MVGAAPSLAGRFYMQAGTTVGRSNTGGGIAVTFPTPFPNGLLTVLVTFGSSGVYIWEMHTATYTKSDFVGVVTNLSGTPLATTTVRLNWIAIGF